MSRRSLMIGAFGQVGRQLVSMVGADRVIASSRQGGADGSIRLDLASFADDTRKAAALVEALDLDAVYCLGAMTGVDGCESEPNSAMRINCYAPAAFAEAAASHDIPFIYFSSEYVFDGAGGPYDEDAAANPINAYGRSKFLGERAVTERHPNALIVRTTVVYGPDPRERNFLYALRKALLSGSVFPAAADQISTPSYNRDVAAAVVALVRAGAGGVFHVVGPERLSRFDFAARAAGLMGLDCGKIIGLSTAELGQRAPRPLNAGLSGAKLGRVAPGVRMRNLEEALRDWAPGGAEGVV
jgi:dTDP-4-dehydrorhamnose reductase